MMGSQVEPVKEGNPIPSSEPKPGEAGMEARVAAIWEQMNARVSNKTVKMFSNKRSASTMNSISTKLSDNWMTYLGLAPKETASHVQDSQLKGSNSDMDKKIDAMWDQMNSRICNKMLKSFSNKSSSTADNSSQLKSDNWMTLLGLTSRKAGGSEKYSQQQGISGAEYDNSHEARKLAAAALSAVKDAAAVASGRGKVEITEVRDFAGHEIEIKKLVDAESKEAAEKAKALAPSAVDVVLEQIKKKPKLSVLDKTKKDWGEFKDENKGIEEELDAYKKSSNQYLDKVSFLQRADYREFERERDARLALQARRRQDMRGEP
ncbi:hypothetical protein K2173_017423 [Erythroxylum novogranatense]|uniref:BCNT-C domain-containing protein n=1 Tax=Erythroxylum novogranatense TaxID=1862640 RepID=A0AAV8TMN5_9ROSI|nr:hypothetical protein K2173_017423 [Erythroxylum novogranatense]